MFPGLLILMLLGLLPCPNRPPWSETATMPQSQTSSPLPSPPIAIGQLEHFAGTWELTILHWVKPATPPITGNAVAQATVRMGGRYLMVEVAGQLGSQPVEGIFVQGLNAQEGRAGAIWIDNRTNQPDILQAVPGQEGFSWTIPWSFPGAGPQKSDTFRTIRIHKGQYLFQRFRTLPDGSCFKTLECQFERRSSRSVSPGN